MSDQEPVLTRDGTTPLYWLDAGTRLAGFLATDPGALGPSPTLTATWGDGRGVYVLLGAAPADTATFVADLDTYLSFQADRPRFLWIADPAVGPYSWTPDALFAGARVDRRADLRFADYTLVVRDGTTVVPADAGGAGWGFVLGDDAVDAAVTLFAPDGLFPAATGSCSLGFEPATAGTWRCTFVAEPAGDGPDGLARLGCGIRYFTAGEDGAVAAVRFSALRQPAATAVSLAADLDPLRPLDPARTALRFLPDATTGDPVRLRSGYATARGYGVDLTPLPGGEAGPAAGLVFGFAPFFVGGGGDQPVPGGYYLVPDGPFSVDVVPPEGTTAKAAEDGVERLLCGASGLEYLGVPPAGGSSLVFVAGREAFAPLTPERTGEHSLTDLGTTAWVQVRPGTGSTVRYYAQPEDAPLFRAPAATRAGDEEAIDLLEFLELPAGDLPTTGAPPAFPMAPFRDLDAAELADALAIEQLALAPRRRAALTPAGLATLDAAAAATAAAGPATGGVPTATVGVTPQGLGVGVAADGLTWTWVGIGHTGEQAAEPDLRFTVVKGRLQQALLTNNLFLVLGNAREFADGGSVAYELGTYVLDVIATLPPGDGVPPEVLAAVRAAMADRRYGSLDEFEAAVRTASPGIDDHALLVLRRYAGLLTAVVGGWPFRLSPDNWVNDRRASGANTYLLFKFVLGRSLASLVADVSTWAWPEVASADGDPAAAQAEIAAVLAASTDPHFDEVVADPWWTGVLALSVDVPLEQLPAELQVLAAGIDASAFQAHHLGFSATPYHVGEDGLAFTRSSMFGLIDYRNPDDQYSTGDVPYAFRVLQLTVGIRNSVVTTFASRVQLLVNRLFGAAARLFPTDHGNNVVLDGAHQRQRLPDGTEHDGYVFSMTGFNRFQVDGLVLQTVDVLSAQLTTTKAADPEKGDTTVDATFVMAGDLRFYEPAGFDPFCWGPLADGSGDSHLRFGNLGIGMSFEMGDPAGTTTFTVRDGNLSFDLANSEARPDAFVSRFPARLAGLVATPDPAVSAVATAPSTPADMGYASVTAPIQQQVLSQPWYGLVYRIDLGTLGALAGNTAIGIDLLTAWSPGVGGADPAVYVGVKLPGTKEALGVSLPLQGIVKLGFKSIELQVDQEPGQPRTYTLRMRDFALRLLGLAFPPGHNDVLLFGNPAQAGDSKVGWYAAYASDEDPKKPVPPPTRQALAGARPALRRGEGS